MKKNTVVLDFIRFSVPNKITFGRTVIPKMSALALFSNPDVPYEEATTNVNKLESLYVASRSGNHEQTALMHQTSVEFDNIFRKLAKQVDRVADGDEAIILSTGFHLAKQPVSSEKPDYIVEPGEMPGSMMQRRKAVAGAASYVWQYAIGAEPTSDDKWVLGGSTTQTTFEQKGLPSGAKVWFRVAAVTKAGMQAFTDAIMKIIP